jgi:hypothetical protein
MVCEWDSVEATSDNLSGMTVGVDRDEIVTKVSAIIANMSDSPSLQSLPVGSHAYGSAQMNEIGEVSGAELLDLGAGLQRYLGWTPQSRVRVNFPNGQSSSGPEALAVSLLARAKARGAETGLREWEAFVELNSVRLTDVTAVWGLHPSRSFEVAAGIWLGPLSEAPDSRPREFYCGESPQLGAPFGNVILPRPRAALWYEFDFGPIVQPDLDDMPTLKNPRRWREVSVIVACLNLLSLHQVESVAHWFYAPADTPFSVNLEMWEPIAFTSMSQGELPPEPVDEELIRQTVQRYFGLTSRNQSRLEIVLNRLMWAKVRTRAQADRAIDLGIAAEALLIDGGPDGPTELNFKIRVRGAFLASTDPTERTLAFKTLGSIYDLRSRAAHGEPFPSIYESGKEYDRRKAIEVTLASGVEVLTKLVQRVLEIGRIPENWNRVMMGADELSS